MKQLLLFVGPIVLGLIVFFSFLFFFPKLSSGNGALQVTAVPVGNVYLNGKLIGKTPLCKCEGKDMILSGNYDLKVVPLAGDNLLPYEEHITITKGVLTVVDHTFGPGEAGSGSVITLVPLQDTSATELFINSFPVGASVQVDGQSQGVTPLLLKSVTASDHDVLLTKSGYTDKTVHIHTVAGYELSALITLGVSLPAASSSSSFQNASLTPVQKAKVVILDTPTGFLRVRSDPTLTASETAQVKPGDSFDYVDEQDGWYEITLSNGSNGWVSTQYAKKQ